MAFDQALKRRAPISLPPAYKFTVIIVTLVTIGAGIAAAVMAEFWEHPTAMQNSIFDAMGTAWKMGFGAIVGLLGGKQIGAD
ncbi:MAG TPA: hypothetical protein VEI03_12180 [Stellaceae bacterium]|nr:hypothetical protein [Stellaceae bacterium]